MMNEEGLPRVPFSIDELKGISGLIHGHMVYLRTLPAKKERDNALEVLSCLHTKLETQLATSGTVTLPLTPEEIDHILAAFVIFLRRLPRGIPQSIKRDDAANQVNVWLLRLISIITEFRTE